MTDGEYDMKKSISRIDLFSNFRESYEEVSIIKQQQDCQEVKYFIDLLPNNRKLKILDLGCAEGRLSVELAKNGHDVTASDISERFLKQSIEHAKANNVSIKTIKCDIENLNEEFGNKKYDAIYFMDVIEHLRNPIKALYEIRKLLADDGKLFIHTPNVFSFHHLSYYIRHRNKLMNFYNAKNLGDLHFLTYDYLTIEKTLNFVGLKVERIIPTKLMGQRILSRIFPFFSDTLLLRISKSQKINIYNQVKYWDNTINRE